MRWTPFALVVDVFSNIVNGRQEGYTGGMPSGHSLLLPAFLLAVLVLTAIAKALKRRPGGDLPYYSRRFLLSKGEAAFFRILRTAAPANVIIAPKVRLSDLIGCSSAAWKAGFGGRISQKHVDFVLVDVATTAIALVIELDDRTHRQAERRERDVFVDRALAAAAIPVLRVTAARTYNAAELRAAVAERLDVATASSGRPR